MFFRVYRNISSVEKIPFKAAYPVFSEFFRLVKILLLEYEEYWFKVYLHAEN